MKEVFKALADDTRRALLDQLLAKDGQSIAELEQKFELSRFGVAKHLGILERARLVVVRKVGREKRHYLNTVPLQQVYDRWVTQYTAPTSAALTHLKRELEKGKMRKEFEIYIKTTPEELWEAITNPKLREKYNFGAIIESTFEQGSDYQGIGNGRVIFDGENIEVSPPYKLVQSFNAKWSDDVSGFETSRVTFEITQIEDSCRLVVTHDDLPQDANPQLYGGWPMVLSGLKTLLETDQLLTTPGSLMWAS